MLLLERDAALASLVEYAEDARAGDGRVAFVAGEAGVGKTSLIEALNEQVADSTTRWLWGGCEGSFTPRALGPVLDVARQLGGDVMAACADDAPRERIFRTLLDALLQPQRLTVMCIEDAHWADDATLDLLRFLVPRLRRSHVLLLVTYRDDGLPPDHSLRVTLGELATQPMTRRVDLPPLSRDAVSTLASGTGIAPADLFSLTGGNPFLVKEVLDAGVGAGAVPPSARAALLARVARLSADARRALEAAAVIGARVDADLLRQVAAGDDEAIDECLTAGALLSDDQGFRFRHEIARMTVEESLPAHRRTELHRRVLDVLTSAGHPDNARLAHHAEAAGDRDAMLTYAVAAARRASRLGAHREAAAQYRRALKAADDRDAAVRVRLYDALAAEAVFVDDWAGAAEAQQAALALWQQIGDLVRVGDTQRLLTRTMWRLCRGSDAIAAATAAVATLERLPPSVELGWAYAYRATLDFYSDSTASLTLSRKAEAIAIEHGDAGLLSFALNSIGAAKDARGEGGEDELRRALAIALEAADEQQAGRAYTNLQSMLGNGLRLAEAEQIFDQAMAYCENRDLGTYENCLRGAHGGVLDRLGRWDDAVALSTFELEARNLSPVNKIGKLTVLGVIGARRGDPAASAPLDEALALAESSGNPGYLLEVGVPRLEAAWLAGDETAVQREWARVREHLCSREPATQGAAATWLNRVGAQPPSGARVPPPYTLMLAGEWRAAAQEWLQRGCPYDAGLALLDSGDADAMLDAIRVFDRLGAAATVARAQAIVRDAGVRSIPRGRRATTRANPFGLTRREVDVVEGLAGGLTNADIARRLVLAEKTVDNHVSSLLAKMGVRSRHDAARLWADTTAGAAPARAI